MNLRLKLRHLDKFFETKQEIVKEGVVNFLVDVDVNVDVLTHVAHGAFG